MQHEIVNKNKDIHDIERDVEDKFGRWLKKRQQMVISFLHMLESFICQVGLSLPTTGIVI